MTSLGYTADGSPVNRLGLGCFSYGNVDRAESIATIRTAIDLGINHLDTSDAYGAGANEAMVGEAIQGRRARAFITTKFAWVLDGDGKPVRLDGSPAHVRKACEASLKRLRTDYIDLYVEHRIDPAVPIEETVGELARLIDAGKILGYGLSEAGPKTIERAHAVSRVTALQTEYSLWSRDAESELVPLCQRLDIVFVAYSPLGRGFLAGQVRADADLGADDFRRTHPRFQETNLVRNVALMESLAELAQRMGHTPAQLALAWLLSRPGHVYAIPGTRRVEHLRENLRALEIHLTRADRDAIGRAVHPDLVQGARHPAEHMKTIGR
jgi:aryl-alcohol dehydrogenase-like predicted oxidoreductase